MDRVSKLKEDIDKAFHEPLNGSQLWALVKLSKYVRLRARNNSAFNNLMNSLFPQASFRTVTKTKRDGTQYPGLQIAMKGGDIVESEEEEE
jgi:hypothetical protein